MNSYTMNRHIISAIMIIALSPLAASCSNVICNDTQQTLKTSNHDYQDSEKWGKVTAIKLPSRTFHEVELSGTVRMEYTQSKTCSIEVYGNEKAIDAYSIRVDDGELKVTYKENGNKEGTNTYNIPPVTIRIAAPYLSEITGAGALEVVFMKGVEQEKELEVNLSGAGTISIGAFKAPDLEMNISGAGKVTLGDVRLTGNADLNVAGARTVAGKITSGKMRLELTGAVNGELEIHAKQANVIVSGASHLILSGKTDRLEQSSQGVSYIKTDNLKVG
ncbi:MAG: DUF2807 domain-containing protein [Bacteroidaceae bacterium]|nr:DUF2807 domain-containing protein [Bacteroidaceae bacterium]